MNPQQQRHVEILTRLDAGTLDVSTAAELLGLSPRQVRRLRARFAQIGLEAVIHGNQARPPVNRTDPAVVERILALAGPHGKYHDVNVCHLHDLLAREAQITIGRLTLDRLLKQHALLQVDGSPHAWLEDRGPRLTALGAIDDATSKVVSLHFRLTEDQPGYFLLIRTVAQTYGLPMALYHDRHTILQSPKQPG